MKKKLNLGCGTEILEGFVNLDSSHIPGVDVVHNLKDHPWPFEENRFDEIIAHHILEHLFDTPAVMSELWRICAPGGIVNVRVPYWNSSDFISDPTHVKSFNETTFEFFDPRCQRCKERPYYSKARFHIDKKIYTVKIFNRYFPVYSNFLQKVLEKLAAYLCNVIQVMEFDLRAVK